MSGDGRENAGLDSDDLAWRAFCYLHGELTAVEAAAFEEDLAAQQPARESLAQAARLTSALEAAGTSALEAVGNVPSIASRDTASQYLAARREDHRRSAAEPGSAAAWWRRLSRPQFSRQTWAIGIGIAACLAVIVTLGLTGRLGRDVGNGGPVEPGDAQAALAEVWAGIGYRDIHPNDIHNNEEGQSEGWPQLTSAIPPVAASPQDASAHDVDGSVEDHEGGFNLPSVPSWMLAAVDFQANETPEIKQ